MLVDLDKNCYINLTLLLDMFDEYDHISGVYLLVTIQIGKTLIEVYRILTHDIVNQKGQITLIHFAVEIDISLILTNSFHPLAPLYAATQFWGTQTIQSPLSTL